ncbi:MAG: outer membrane beta-barrel protein [Gemmatimonadaceae bacterium]
MRSYRIGLLALISVATMASSASAQSKFRGNVRVGGDFGGEKVLQFQYSDGSTPNVVAGAGLLFSAGAVMEAYNSGGHAAEAQLNVGVKYRTIPPASNQTADWIRVPVEGLMMYRAPRGIRVGGGVALHLANTLQASGDVLNDKVTFKSQPGFLVQAEYVLRNKVSFDVRYTMMKYTVESGGTGEVDANSFGGGLSYWFGGAKAK